MEKELKTKEKRLAPQRTVHPQHGRKSSGMLLHYTAPSSTLCSM